MTVAAILERKRISRNELARRLGHASSGLVSNVASGKSPMPLDKLDAWTKALDLSDADAAEFRRLALAEQAPALAAELSKLQERQRSADAARQVTHRVSYRASRLRIPFTQALDKAKFTPLDYSTLLTAPDRLKLSQVEAIASALGTTARWILTGNPPDPDFDEWMQATGGDGE